ncbi:histidine phosphatase family protein [Aliihoeflea sp. 40Bstr573]|uniref:histidine phosphatase family protein n=1 Tax=Aliihoeflea sp. 40Bstr573 TaxID=2696467 RepID=UPI0020953CC1|nr:histidine phosphatase family protein [Aliihoeflea sp. 40Bstr573]MCO6386122.1 histidine phosphatase family protein [Aliihoeflea sp. 40Bstr573]
MATLTYFIRHGQTDWNAIMRLQGQADTDLNDVGRAQADRNGERLASLQPDIGSFRFVASPLKRTCETMERVRAGAGLPRRGYLTDPRLIEVHFGDWQGKTLEEVEAGRPGSTAEREADKWHFVPPGASGESYDRLMARFRPFFEEITQPTVCVTHGGIVRAVFRIAGGMGADEAAALVIPQDRMLRWDGEALEWL